MAGGGERRRWREEEREEKSLGPSLEVREVLIAHTSQETTQADISWPPLRVVLLYLPKVHTNHGMGELSNTFLPLFILLDCVAQRYCCGDEYWTKEQRVANSESFRNYLRRHVRGAV